MHYDIEGILAVIGIFFLPTALVIVIVALKYNKENNQNQLQADLYAKALAAGLPIPDNLFPEKKKKYNPLNIGIICMGAGVAISLFFLLVLMTATAIGDDAADGIIVGKLGAALGVVPFFIGLAYLLIHFLAKKQQKLEENAK
ncbi:hypothetical protein AGMMS49982_03110 [Bacteroidia bacterium]|nr:hypothetical protein AGMMS49982_03110 [Bacteroidia bacterium]